MPDIYAGIFLGTKTFRLIVGEIDKDGCIINKQLFVESPNLYEGLEVISPPEIDQENPETGIHENPPYNEEALNRAFNSLDVFAKTLVEIKPVKTLAVGRKVINDAKDGQDFLAKIEKRYGWETRCLTLIELSHLVTSGILTFPSTCIAPSFLISIREKACNISVLLDEKRPRDLIFAFGYKKIVDELIKQDPPTPELINMMKQNTFFYLEHTIARFGYPIDPYLKLDSNIDQMYFTKFPFAKYFDLILSCPNVLWVIKSIYAKKGKNPDDINGARLDYNDFRESFEELIVLSNAKRAKLLNISEEESYDFLAIVSIIISIMWYLERFTIIISGGNLLEGLLVEFNYLCNMNQEDKVVDNK
jgi:hypothetical protein